MVRLFFHEIMAGKKTSFRASGFTISWEGKLRRGFFSTVFSVCCFSRSRRISSAFSTLFTPSFPVFRRRSRARRRPAVAAAAARTARVEAPGWRTRFCERRAAACSPWVWSAASPTTCNRSESFLTTSRKLQRIGTHVRVRTLCRNVNFSVQVPKTGVRARSCGRRFTKSLFSWWQRAKGCVKSGSSHKTKKIRV